MARILYIISKGFEKSGAATRAMQFAALAAEKGNDISVALIDDAIHWAQFGMADGIRAATGENMSEMLKKLEEAGGKLLVCKACADKRYVDPDELVQNAKVTPGPEIVDIMTHEAVKVVTF